MPPTATQTMPFPSPKVRRRLRRFGRLLLIDYILLCIVIYFLQTRLIFPGKATQGTTQSIVHPLRGQELAHIPTAHGEKIAVLFAPALTPSGFPHPQALHRPTILYFYGNGENIAASEQIIAEFCRLECNVLTAEFVGYGMSSGSPSQRGVFDTADAAWNYLIQRKDIDPTKVIVIGRSLGGAAAIHLAATKPVAALATLSAFTSMPEMAHKLLPFLPTSLLLRDRFENEKTLANVHCPYFVAHGTSDELVPFKMAARLAAATRSPVTRYNIDGAGHNDVYDVGATSLLNAVWTLIDGLSGK